MENKFRELIGEEFNVNQLDDIMVNMGCYSEYEAFTDELLESGVIIYLDEEDGETQTRIEFKVTIKNSDDEIPQASYVKVIDIDR